MAVETKKKKKKSCGQYISIEKGVQSQCGKHYNRNSDLIFETRACGVTQAFFIFFFFFFTGSCSAFPKHTLASIGGQDLFFLFFFFFF